MKIGLIFILIPLVLTLMSCKERDSSQTNSLSVVPTGHGEIIPGEIIAQFVDTVSQAEAQRFVQGLGLTTLDLSRIETDPLHYGVIGVPVDKEDLWVDSLKKFPDFIKDAGRISVMYQP